MEIKFSFLKKFKVSKNLKNSYGDNALLLYALQLKAVLNEIER